MFYFDQIENKKILKSDFIENAFFTTREICICDKGEDDNFQVKNNIKLLENYLQKKLVSPVQTHSANIDTVKPSRFDYPNTDSLILTNKSQAIFLNFADCTPIILYDEEQNIGAVAHAGWRGTVAKISQKTVKKMISEYNSKPQDIAAVIGPAICAKCYEVGADVYSVFDHSFDSKNCGQGQKFHIDIKEINAKQLAEVGIEKIDVCPYCTCCDNEYFFSYRKENGTTLRHSAVLYLR